MQASNWGLAYSSRGIHSCSFSVPTAKMSPFCLQFLSGCLSKAQTRKPKSGWHLYSDLPFLFLGRGLNVVQVSLSHCGPASKCGDYRCAHHHSSLFCFLFCVFLVPVKVAARTEENAGGTGTLGQADKLSPHSTIPFSPWPGK